MVTKTNKNSNSNANNVIKNMHAEIKEIIKEAKKAKDKNFAGFLMSTVELTEVFEQSAKDYVKHYKLVEQLKLMREKTGYYQYVIFNEDDIKNLLKDYVTQFMNQYEDVFEKTPLNRDSYTEFATAIFEQELGFKLL